MKYILNKSMEISSRFLSSLKRVMLDPMGFVGVFLVGLFLFSAVFAPIISPYDPSDFVGESLAGPSISHPIGTDELGRDTFCRVIYGGRIELVLAIVAVSVSLFLGLILGIIAGYGPVWLDNCMVLLFDTIRSFPSIMLSLAILALSGPSVIIIGVVFIINAAPGYGRIARAQTFALKNKEFVMAEQSLGVRPMRMILHHLLPNIIGPLLILCAMDIPVVVTVEAGLSFLGLGVLPPTPTWGTILNEGFSVIRETPWPVLAGGIPLILTTLGFTFLGETLRDLFDPKLKGK